MSKPEGRPQTAKAGRTQVSRGTSPHHDAAVATEMSRSATSREAYELRMKLGVILLGALGVSIAGNVYLGTRPQEVRFVAMDSEGRVRPIETLSSPLQSQNAVLNWAAQAVTKAYTVSFANHQQELAEVKPFFTDSGWKGYQEALQRSGFVDNIVKNQFVTTAVPRAAPTIVAQGLVDGTWGWRLQVPVIVSYTSASIRDSQQLTVEVTIVRRPEAENAAGLGIAQIVSN